MTAPGRDARLPIDLGQATAAGSVLLLLVFLIKVYSVARYSLTTMTGLVVATPLQVALGTVASYAYLVMPALAMGTAWLAAGWLREPHRAEVAPAAWPILAVIITVTTLMSPVDYLRLPARVGATTSLLHRRRITRDTTTSLLWVNAQPIIRAAGVMGYPTHRFETRVPTTQLEYLRLLHGRTTSQGALPGVPRPRRALGEVRTPDRLLEDLILAPDLLTTLTILVSEVARWPELDAAGVPRRQRFLFQGPPGCGKTSTAEALACELGRPFLLVRLDAVRSSYLGETASNLRRILDYANQAPFVVAIAGATSRPW